MQRGGLSDRIVLAGIVAVALSLAIGMLGDYYSAPDGLWRDLYHDRNGHFDFGLTLALALRELNPVDFFAQIERSRVWGPFHGLVLSLVLLFGGIDYRIAIVPSLIGWTVTVTFAALIARRFFSDPAQRAIASACAAALVMASPAFRLLGSDVMLEGLGAGLTAIAIWAWIVAHEQPQSASRWRFLAVALTLLFFHKGNYWGLLIASMAIAWVSADFRRLIVAVRDLQSRFWVKDGVRAMIRDPLLIACVLVALAALAIALRGPTSIAIFGKPVQLYPPANLTTAAYALLFLRLTLWWRRHRAAIEPELGAAGRQMLLWHAMPIAVSFLLPKRLSTFLWFVGPANDPSKASYSLTGGFNLYWDSFSIGFSAASWVAALALVLFAIALLRIRSFPRSAWIVFIFAAVSLAAVLIHPQRQGRFLGSWVFSVWIGAGAGAGVLLGLVAPLRAQAVRWAGAVTAVAILTTALVRQPPSANAAAYAIRTTSGPSNLDLVRPILEDVRKARTIGMAATFGITPLLRWTAQEHCKCRRQVAQFNPGIATSRDGVRAAMLDYIGRSAADRLVVFDVPDSPAPDILGWQYNKLAGILDALEVQQRYGKTAEYAVPSYGAQVSVWDAKP